MKYIYKCKINKNNQKDLANKIKSSDEKSNK